MTEGGRASRLDTSARSLIALVGLGCAHHRETPPAPTAPTTLWFSTLSERSREPGQVLRVPIAGGEPEVVVASLTGRYDVSPSGRSIAWVDQHRLWVDGVAHPELGPRVDSPLFTGEGRLAYVRQVGGRSSAIAELDTGIGSSRDRHTTPSVWDDVGLVHGPNGAIEFVSNAVPMSLAPDDVVSTRQPRSVPVDWRADGRLLVWDSKAHRLSRLDASGQVEHTYEAGILLGGFVGDDRLLLERRDEHAETVRVFLTELDGSAPRELVRDLPLDDQVLFRPWCVLDERTFVIIGDEATSVLRVAVSGEEISRTPLVSGLASVSWLQCR